MATALFVPEGSLFLAEQWLARIPVHVAVTLVCFAEQESVARELSRRYRCVDRVELIGRHGLSKETEPFWADTQLVLPLQPKQFLLRHFKPNLLPDLVPHYDLFRDLWFAGFREFEMFHLGGTKRFEIPHILDEFEGLHRGERCFIVGNGPSLNDIDMTKLEREITYGSNRCYLGYDKWGFAFKYWGIADWLQMEEYWQEYEEAIPNDTIKFFPFDYLPYFHFEEACPVRINIRNTETPKFTGDKEWIHLGTTVTHFLLQIAIVMGCNPIVLVGVDHRYPLKQGIGARSLGAKVKGRIKRTLERKLEGTALHDLVRTYARVKAERLPSKPPTLEDPTKYWTAGDTEKPTHFDSGYAGGREKRFVVPIPEWSERQFNLAAKWAKEHHITVLNATPNTALRSFEKVRYEDLF